ncbi:MAG: OsmC family protein [Flavobacteriales bacterium]
MHSMEISYLGDLQTESTHLKSGNKVITDAPVDNNGKGSAYSPTDLLCNALASCMITLMGIAAASHNIQLGKIDAKITKTMASNPRRVSEIKIEMIAENKSYSEKEKTILENAANTCPVAKSIHPDIHVDFSIVWS